MAKFPGRVVHSKHYRSPRPLSGQKVLVIGNSASGQDITAELRRYAHLPVYQSRRSKSRWDGNDPPVGVDWKPVVKSYELDGQIIFEDGTSLEDVDKVIYCTGYKASFPFWNSKKNGQPLWDYVSNKLKKSYWHTFFQEFPTLGIVGLPRVLTFRSFEYQAIALGRVFSGRNTLPLPPKEEQKKWEEERLKRVKAERKKFHDIEWETGETMAWLEGLFRISGLSTLKGDGRVPPVLDNDVIWAVENIRKYPVPKQPNYASNEDTELEDPRMQKDSERAPSDWVFAEANTKDLLSFI
jgi:hypothetical protein